MQLLAAAGRESERDLAFAGLYELLRPVLGRLASLPARQAAALRGAFALSEDPVPRDALLTGIAVLTLLSGLSDEQPLLVVADDVQWLDRASLDALAFAVFAERAQAHLLVAGALRDRSEAGYRQPPPAPRPGGPRGETTGQRLARPAWSRQL
jgi:hypothetical protein